VLLESKSNNDLIAKARSSRWEDSDDESCVKHTKFLIQKYSTLANEAPSQSLQTASHTMIEGMMNPSSHHSDYKLPNATTKPDDLFTHDGSPSNLVDKEIRSNRYNYYEPYYEENHLTGGLALDPPLHDVATAENSSSMEPISKSPVVIPQDSKEALSLLMPNSSRTSSVSTIGDQHSPSATSKNWTPMTPMSSVSTNSPCALSSDAFSRFSEKDPDMRLRNREVYDATVTLLFGLLPALVSATNIRALFPLTFSSRLLLLI
jgi:hypothetical protein